MQLSLLIEIMGKTIAAIIGRKVVRRAVKYYHSRNHCEIVSV